MPEASTVPLVPARLVRGARGAVVAPHHLATQAGLGVLAAGGSAVDAAIATNAVLGVVMPNGCGLGGDAFWLVWDEAAGEQVAINGSGRSPAAADAAALRDRGLDRIPLRGPLSITTPGAVRSWGDAHARWGRLSRDAILAPAIEQAEAGFPAWDGPDLGRRGHRRRLRVRAVGPGAGRDLAPERPAMAPGRARPAPGARSDPPHARERRVRRVLRRRARGAGRGRARRPPARRSRPPTSATTARRSATPSPRPTAASGSRPTRPTAAGSSPSRSCASSSASSPVAPPPSAPTAGPTPRGSTSSSRPPSWRSRSATRTLTDPEVRVTSPWTTSSTTRGSRRLAARIDPRRAEPNPPPARTLVGGTIYLAVVDAEGNAVSLIQSNAAGFGSGVLDAGDRRPLPGPRRLVQPRPGAPERPRAAQADRAHAAARDAVPGRRAAAMGRRGVDGRRHPAPDPCPARVRARGRRGGHPDGRGRAARRRGARRLARAAGRRPR